MAADVKISDLQAATTVDDTDLVPIVQGGTTKKATQNQICTKIYDGSHVLAVDFGARAAKGLNGFTVFDWNNGFTLNGPLGDASQNSSISVNSRQLIANDGSTVALDWSDTTNIQIFNQGINTSSAIALANILFNSGLGANGRIQTGDDTGFASNDGNTYFDNSGFHGVLTGTATNDDAAAGKVGEYVSSLIAVGSATSLTTATAKNITSMSLTAGDWDVEGLVSFTEGTATVSARTAGINTSTATIPTDGSEGYCGVQSTLTSELNSITLPRKRISIASTTTVYLVGKATFSAGSCSGFGAINARRIR